MAEMPVRSWGSHPAVGRASRNGLQDRGGGGEIADAGRCRMCKDGFPSWASREQLITRSQFEHQSKVPPWVVLSPVGAYTPGLPKSLAHSFTLQTMLPPYVKVQTKKDTVAVHKEL